MSINSPQIATIRPPQEETEPKYDKDIAALLAVGPYNDFISEGGKIWHAAVSDGSGRRETRYEVLRLCYGTKPTSCACLSCRERRYHPDHSDRSAQWRAVHASVSSDQP